MRRLLAAAFLTTALVSCKQFLSPQQSKAHQDGTNASGLSRSISLPAGQYRESIAILPDTQYYTSPNQNDHRNMYDVQARHITGEYGGKMLQFNIKATIHLGDHVNGANDWPNFNEGWNNVAEARTVLENRNMLFLPVEGNHDVRYFDSIINTDEWSEHHMRFDDEFESLLNNYQAKPEWYHAHNQGPRNMALRQTVDGTEFLLLSLEYDADYADYQWADATIDAWAGSDKEKRVILAVHDYLGAAAGTYELSRTTKGDSAWNNLVLINDHIDFVICGHKMGDNIRRVSRNGSPPLLNVVPNPPPSSVNPLNNPEDPFIRGRHVYEILIDFQDDEQGGNGWYKVLQFSEGKIYMAIERPGDPVPLTHDRYPSAPEDHDYVVDYSRIVPQPEDTFTFGSFTVPACVDNGYYPYITYSLRGGGGGGSGGAGGGSTSGGKYSGGGGEGGYRGGEPSAVVCSYYKVAPGQTLVITDNGYPGGGGLPSENKENGFLGTDGQAATLAYLDGNVARTIASAAGGIATRIVAHKGHNATSSSSGDGGSGGPGLDGMDGKKGKKSYGLGGAASPPEGPYGGAGGKGGNGGVDGERTSKGGEAGSPGLAGEVIVTIHYAPE